MKDLRAAAEEAVNASDEILVDSRYYGEPALKFRRSIDALRTALAQPPSAEVQQLEAENAELRKELRDAATSLETISNMAGRETYGNPPIETFMDSFCSVRAYAKGRCGVARAALKDTP